MKFPHCSISRYLNIKKANPDYSTIMFSIYVKGQRTLASSGISCPPSCWSKVHKQVTAGYNRLAKSKKGFKDSIQLNHQLQQLELKIDDAISKMDEITSDNIKFAVKNLLIGNVKIKAPEKAFSVDDSSSLVSYFKLIRDKRKRNKEDFSYRTIIKYNTMINHIETYELTRKKKLDFEAIDENFYRDFLKYLYDQPNGTKANNNTAFKILQIIRTFMNEARKQGYTNNIKELNFKINSDQSPEDTVALNDMELKKIEEADLKRAALRNVRDLFLIECYTSLRYSDLMKLDKYSIKFDIGEIHVVQEKTKKNNKRVIRIPILDRARKILEKYYPDFNLPKLSNQKYNDYIKEVCKIAEINEEVRRTFYYGNKEEQVVKPKHEFISSHTARRTFITLALKKGLMPEMVMKISGHKSRASFQKYVKLTEDETINAVKNAFDG